MTYDCDVDLDYENLNFVLDIPFHYALAVCEI